ncbi:glycerol kinase GlpK [Urechidicola croceus]|uniref:Glycerol kinase n=1 Tax=Urechidicola croceus TaxID=1850246 RepID=A0A1D8P929_9FLAO|nr:glycerol kinase GlpK [Urechidicola croceus]AOW21073.1 glycerol kinase [Urechidicola croceus]
MSKKYIIALDQGTTSSRSVLFDEKGSQIAIEQQEFEQIFPKSGWVEHDPMEILKTQLTTFENLIENNNIDIHSIAGIGITNQRETTVVWNKKTGVPIYNAIVWQDKRTAYICEELKKKSLSHYVKQNTGLVIDSYFSGTKIKWILDHVESARVLAENEDLLFGTIDTWLVWNLTEKKVHVTDYSNASRTLIFNIKILKWDDNLLDELDIPKSMLPEVKPSSFHFGDFEYNGHKIPIGGIAGDQQAALFGQACFKKGEAKNTYGTGCFLLMNTGKKMQLSENGLLTTIAWGIEDNVYYALEGSVFIGGAAIQWLRDGLQIIDSAHETEKIAAELTDENPVYVVPAFAGLGAPYWDMYAKGAIFGLTRDTGKNHIVRATLDSIAYQSKDLILAMEQDSGVPLKSLKVDGGACNNNVLMQFQSDILNTEIERPKNTESTALGVAYLTGITIGLWKQEDIIINKKIERKFVPKMDKNKRNQLYKGWKKAIKRTMNWSDE